MANRKPAGHLKTKRVEYCKTLLLYKTDDLLQKERIQLNTFFGNLIG